MYVNATFWHRAKIYFTCIKSLFWLITEPNVNNINLFFSTILQETDKIKENIAIITQISHKTKYFISVSNTWHLITVPYTCMHKINPFFSEISKQIQVARITQIWHRAKCYFTSMSNASYLITVPNGSTRYYATRVFLYVFNL